VKHPLKPMNAKVLLVGESWVSSSKAKEGSETLAMLNDHPLLVVGTFGDGRTVAWTSDIGPHWCPREFVDWIIGLDTACARMPESDRTLRDGFLGGAVPGTSCQATIAPSPPGERPFAQRLWAG
jgi:Putative glutamine amidotransferase